MTKKVRYMRTFFMSNHSTSTSQVLKEVQKILTRHYGIKIAAILKCALENGVRLEDLAAAYYGEAKSYAQRKSNKQSIRNLVEKYGGAN